MLSASKAQRHYPNRGVLADAGFPHPPGLKDAARLASADRLSAAEAAIA